MVATPSISIGMISCGFILCLSLSNVTQADEYRKYDPCAKIPGRQPNPVKCDEHPQKGIHTITGEVLHINGANLLVKQSNGEEVISRIDLSTKIGRHITTGSHIEAKVNEVEGERHALSIRSVR